MHGWHIVAGQLKAQLPKEISSPVVLLYIRGSHPLVYTFKTSAEAGKLSRIRSEMFLFVSAFVWTVPASLPQYAWATIIDISLNFTSPDF